MTISCCRHAEIIMIFFVSLFHPNSPQAIAIRVCCSQSSISNLFAPLWHATVAATGILVCLGGSLRISVSLCICASVCCVLHMPLNRVASCLICLFECLSDSAWLAVWHFVCLVVVAAVVACVVRQMFCLAWTFTALRLMDDGLIE